MLRVKIDGTQLEDRQELHKILVKELEFPAWYGGFVDALHDCLTELNQETEIVFIHPEVLKERLGNYADRLFRVMERSARENPCIRICLEE